MSQDVMIFWLIHVVIGVVVPVLALTGCCRREEEKETAQQQPPLHEQSSPPQPHNQQYQT